MGKEKAKVYLYTRVSTSMQIDGYKKLGFEDKVQKYKDMRLKL